MLSLKQSLLIPSISFSYAFSSFSVLKITPPFFYLGICEYYSKIHNMKWNAPNKIKKKHAATIYMPGCGLFKEAILSSKWELLVSYSFPTILFLISVSRPEVRYMFKYLHSLPAGRKIYHIHILVTHLTTTAPTDIKHHWLCRFLKKHICNVIKYHVKYICQRAKCGRIPPSSHISHAHIMA